MPSTYSSNLRIELIGTGDQVGTWGQTTNQNLGTLLEDAVTGYTSVAVSSANQALTALNGAPDQSRNQTIALTTSTGAAFNVYAPPAPKTYIIYNTSAYAATIFNSSVLGNTTAAGTGVTIPAGRTMTVWSDGTNFRTQLDSAPTQGFGTNNTTLANTAFVQAALQALHPVGSVYINATNSANPATYFGFGTWVAFGAGRVPVGFNASDPLFDAAEETGGSKDAVVVSHTHTFSGTTGNQSANHTHGITINDPGHTHAITWNSGSGTARSGLGGGSNGQFVVTETGIIAGNTTGITASSGGVSQDHNHSYSGTTASTGSSGTNANLPPYITVFMWKRTA